MTAGNVGKYVQVSKILWVAVDTAFNDFAIAGVFGGSTASAVTHGVKAKVRISGDANIIGSSNAATTENVHDATGILIGVR